MFPTVEDVKKLTGATASDQDLDLVLGAAIAAIQEILAYAVYETDAEGRATSPTMRADIYNATLLQARIWLQAGTPDHTVTGNGQAPIPASVSIGPLSLSTAAANSAGVEAASRARMRVAPTVLRLLRPYLRQPHVY
ncbi:hypothetical protein ACRQFN_02300 [Actinotignum sp. GS-2025e]|uniref:hypothetical protein n=1 Tax=unclassified Actinotignum TaxID=2632702 RepID=UPI003F460F75